MGPDFLAVAALSLAAIPAGLFALNLLVYRRLPRVGDRAQLAALSVLIPARNEERNIRVTLEAVLANSGCDFEVVVLDDHSTDRTASIVREVACRDPRVRLKSAPPLPAGWCGKQHACHALAGLARNPLLVFIDADVRLAPDALARMAGFMARIPAALASGVPRQETGTFSERLLLPLIHFVLLGYLPMHAMRWTRLPGMSGGCGQLFVAWRDAYDASGGHAALRDSLHDGIKLPRVFRRAGFTTDLFDATDLATCRMYQTHADTWRGLGKNATEGLAAPGTIGPMTLLLAGGQVLPFILIALTPGLSPLGTACAAAAAMLSLLQRLFSAWRFRQPFGSALLHPLGVLALLAIQWQALARRMMGKHSEWKGRSYPAVSRIGASPCRMSPGTPMLGLVLVLGVLFARGEIPAPPQASQAPSGIELRDQYDAPQKLVFPSTNLTLLTIADKRGSDQVAGWVDCVLHHYAGKLDVRGIADVAGVPGPLRGRVRKAFQKRHSYPVMMDWSGAAAKAFGYTPGQADVLLLDYHGRILKRTSGEADPASTQAMLREIDQALARGQSADPPRPTPHPPPRVSAEPGPPS